MIVDDWRVTVCVCSAAHLAFCSRSDKKFTNNRLIKNKNNLNECQVLHTDIQAPTGRMLHSKITRDTATR